MDKFKLLVVDDDDLIIQSLQIALPDNWALCAHQSPQNIPKGSFHAAFVDMHLKGDTTQAEGLSVIKTLRSENPHLEIVAMSGNLDRELMEDCLKAGASRYLAKPLSVDEISLTLDKIESLFLLQNATQRGTPYEVNWVGSSDESKAIKRQIASLRGEDGPLLIEGESGTGKEVVARIINEQELGRPFLAVNIAAIPENLFESEIFGHVRGAFTGADQNKMGLAEAAHNGDLFLDEIEALSLPLQVKLLRFLETGEIRRVGSSKSIQVKTRVIAATNKSLAEMVNKNEFREDLYWRLKGKSVSIPPLRERKEDLIDLAQHFISQDPIRKKKLESEAIEIMNQYNWPGNVRELKRVCEQVMLQAPLPVIRAEDIQKVLTPQNGPSTAPKTIQDVNFDRGLTDIISDYESKILKQGLKKYKDIDKLSKVLKVSRSNLYKKIKEYDIHWR